MKLLTTNRVFFSFIVSGRLFREKWSAFFKEQTKLKTIYNYANPVLEIFVFLHEYNPIIKVISPHKIKLSA